MTAALVQLLPASALTGIIALWLGVILMFIRSTAGRLRDGTTLRTIALPPARQAARNIERLSSDMQEIGKTRISRLGRVLATFGLSLLLLSGLLWVVLLIARGPTPTP